MHATRTPLGRWAIDEFGAGYVFWREECQAVWLAYERWSEADRGDHGLAHAAYVAALDREERAARAYADSICPTARISA